MKEQKTYIALDADNVGDSIGGAVLNDDAQSLSSLSQNITAGTQIFVQWAEFNGGSVISNGSDEAILQVPTSALGDLENLKQKYQEMTGFTMSIGTGETVSAAAKALIYSKMSGKDQISAYTPQMEDAMKQAMSDDMPEAPMDEKFSSDKEDMLEDESPAKEAIPEHEADLSPEEKALHDSTEEMSDEEEVEQEELAAQAKEGMPEESEDEAMEDMVDSELPQEQDIDLDGQPDVDEAHGEIMPEEDDIDADGDVEHEEAMAVEAGAEEEYSDEGDFADDAVDMESDELSESIADEMGAEEEMSEEIPEEMADEEMSDELPMEEEMSMEEMAEESEEEMPMEEEMPQGEEEMASDEEALKNVIYESLQNFKAHREYLEGISQENPELYNSLIFVLQAMIEMAKELGYGSMQDDSMLGDEDEIMGSPEETVDEAMEIEEEMEDEEESDESADMAGDEESGEEKEEESEEKKKENPFAKNERYIALMKKMNTVFESLSKKDKENSIEELKEQVKEAQKKQKKNSKKSKKKLKEASDKKKKPSKAGQSNSFCAKSHLKMKKAGKDCRSNEDENSPVCMARKKYNCRGKNEEKNKKMAKSDDALCDGDFKDSEKLSKFLSKKRKKQRGR